jgi:hypothetical protein
VQETASRIRSLPDTRDTTAVFSIEVLETASENDCNAIGTAMVVQDLLNTLGLHPEAHALSDALRRPLDAPAYVGSGVLPANLGGPTCDRQFIDTLIHHLPFFLEAPDSTDAIEYPLLATRRESDPSGPSSRPMDVIEKIITQSATGLTGSEVTSGQMVCVRISDARN